MTVLAADLDDHRFAMPVVFFETPVDIFGRAGLLDQFDIELDSRAMRTSFTWTGGAEGAEPWAATYSRLLKKP
jgi:hypothetical protein